MCKCEPIELCEVAAKSNQFACLLLASHKLVICLALLSGQFSTFNISLERIKWPHKTKQTRTTQVTIYDNLRSFIWLRSEHFGHFESDGSSPNDWPAQLKFASRARFVFRLSSAFYLIYDRLALLSLSLSFPVPVSLQLDTSIRIER